jgi:hypothetical protein
MAYGTYKLTDKKCATCSYWDGTRTIDFRANTPKYIKADSGSFGCMAQSGKKTTANSRCLKYRIWEKIS